MNNILELTNRKQFREWLLKNYNSTNECFLVNLKRGVPKDDGIFYYVDAVEEALCFGWIDGKLQNINGKAYQRFSPRRKKSNWTMLNIARCKRLIELGLMQEAGLNIMPKFEYEFDQYIVKDLKEAQIYDLFLQTPILYQQIKIANMSAVKAQNIALYQKQLSNLITKTKQNKLIPGWDDGGRLKDIII